MIISNNILPYGNIDSDPNPIMLSNLGLKINSFISVYNQHYKNIFLNPKANIDCIIKKLEFYIREKYSLINISNPDPDPNPNPNLNPDINYYIEQIIQFSKQKFHTIIEELNIKHLITLLDYNQQTRENYLNLRVEYHKLFYEIIIKGEYVLASNKAKLYELINTHWTDIKFNNFIEFMKIFNKLHFLNNNTTQIDIDLYLSLIANKFDSIENINKLFPYINEILFENLTITNSDPNPNPNDIIEINFKEWEQDSNKHNLKFILSILKSNGYLLFEEYYKQLIIKFILGKQIIEDNKINKLDMIKKEKILIDYFIYIHTQKTTSNVTRQVNELLLKINSFINELLANYYNNIGYKKIKIKQESDKYKSVNLKQFNRSITSFNIFKYSITNPKTLIKFNLKQYPQIEPYFDIYKSYYKSRYPDREIEFDLFCSTIYIKMNFVETYYIHMALIQYIILDLIYKNDIKGIGLNELSDKTGLELNSDYFEKTINSLINLNIVKHNNGQNIEEFKLYINNEFEYSHNKISICSDLYDDEFLINNQEELLYQRDLILLSNVYDYIKKNQTFSKNKLFEKLILPFVITMEQLDIIIQKLLDSNHIVLFENTEFSYPVYKYLV